jgi:ketosteroid isomerase-like protein
VSERDVQIARRLLEAVQSGSMDSAADLVHPEIEFDTRVRPDGKVWRGVDGAGRAMLEWTDAWSEWTLEIERYLDAGEGRVLALWNERGRARGSEAEISLEGVTVLTVHDGLIVSVVVSVDRERTLEAFDLDEI